MAGGTEAANQLSSLVKGGGRKKSSVGATISACHVLSAANDHQPLFGLHVDCYLM